MLILSLFLILATPMISSAAGGEEPKADAADSLSAGESREYREKSAKLSGLEVKIKDLNSLLAQLVELKKREKDPEKVRQIMNELVTNTKERNKAAAEHRRLKSHLLYRFPNLGEVIHQKYGIHEDASVEQLEKAQGLNELLDETKSLIQTKYAPILKETEGRKESFPLPPKKVEKKPLRLVK